MIDTPQRIELYFCGEQAYIEVWRFDTQQELQTALLKSDVRNFDAKTMVYVETIAEGPQWGRIYLADKSISAMALVATRMAFHMGHRGHVIDYVAEWEDIIADLTGKIMSELYSKNKYF